MNYKDIYNKEYFDSMKRRKSATYRPTYYRITKRVLDRKAKTVLDVGCGCGYLVLKMREKRIEAIGVDFSDYAGEFIPEHFVKADANNLPFPDNSFDVVVSKDFFEHLPEEEIDKVYSEMKRVGGHIIATICFKPEKYHLTIKPKEWWEKKLPDCEII